ncbi:MAG: hypothetical protein J0L81_16330 [Caulobacterales bacterium]|nr:hypothetical protein [Caulobacterales bacterium]
MSSRLWPILASVFGVATLGVFVAFGQLPEAAAVYEPQEVGLAVGAFQRSTTLADLAVVFGDPANSAIVAAMDAINTLDLYAFIPAYTLFLIAAAFMLGAGKSPQLMWAAIAAGVLGAGADAVETFQQLRLTADYQNAAAHLPLIAPAHWVKYFGLGACAALFGALCFTGARKRWIIGVLAMLTLPLVAAAFAGLIEARVFTGALGAFWTALLVVALIEAVRGRGAPA